MLKKILIDALYPEETKFVLLGQNNRLEEFSYQNGQSKMIKGNIYLGKVDRVEPSLQAAFIDYGQEKKGFLSFEMIHPKYYQIPTSDKENLLGEIKLNNPDQFKDNIGDTPESFSQSHKTIDVESQGKYKIQEVIKKNQIILVQVYKEERGNKGAFLSTYVSLSGRYCVFSPNSFRPKIGVSKKLEDEEERKRLKDISKGLLTHYDNSSIIFRTASAYRPEVEIIKDFECLTRIWEKIKNSALSSCAPSIIYDEGDILISSIKQNYTSDVERIIVSGKEAYKKIHNFLDIFIPKNISKLQEYTSHVPILHHYNIAEQLNELYSDHVKLKSGGYIVINTTEAMVCIDVNSGNYTEEYSIENTALNINLEAAREIARQIKLRGISGLIVIDFIDMSELNNKKLVEKEFKKSFWHDRYKVHIGRISEFGLLEMSRQRIGKSFVEATSKTCKTCLGGGKVVLSSAIASLLIGKISYLLSKKKANLVNVSASTDVVTYLINNFKSQLNFLETNYSLRINLYVDDLIARDKFNIMLSKSKNDSKIENRRFNIPEEYSTVQNKIDRYSLLDNKSLIDRTFATNGQERKNIKNNKRKKTDCVKNYQKTNERGSLLRRIWSKVLS